MSTALPIAAPPLPSILSLRPPLLASGEPVPRESPDLANTLTLDLAGVTPTVLNALRRAIITSVPSLAISYVFHQYNTSLMVNDQLSHALGLVDLRALPEELDPLPETFAPAHMQAGDVTGRAFLDDLLRRHPRSLVRFLLDVECYLEDGKIVNGDVLASHLRPAPIPGAGQDAAFAARREPSDWFVHPDHVIAHLAPGQRIVLEAWACVAGGSEHARFKPATTCFYQQKNLVTVRDLPSSGDVRVKADSRAPGWTGERDIEDLEDLGAKLVAVCPKRVFAMEGGKVSVANPLRCDACGDCFLHKDLADFVSVEADPANRFHFFVEGKGRLPVRRILLAAVRRLRSEFARLDPAHASL